MMLLMGGMSVSASTTIYGPEEVIADNTSEYIFGPVDTSNYENIHLSFEYNAEALESGESFTYGWRTDSNNNIDTIDGLPEGANGLPDDEIGAVSISLPAEASSQNLEIYVLVSSGSDIRYDYVEITNLLVTGDLVPPADEDNDGIIEGDYCPGTNPDEAGIQKLNPNHWRFDGTSWLLGLNKAGQGRQNTYTIQDTRGCGCDQIINYFQSMTGDNYKGHSKFGCSAGLIEDFISIIW